MKRKSLSVVCLVMIDEKGFIFAAQRPPEKKLGLHWEFPGGKIEPGEDPESALRREIREELSLELGPLKKLPETNHEYDFADIHLIPYLSHCEKRPTVTLSEHIDFSWISPPALADYKWAQPISRLSNILQMAALFMNSLPLGIYEQLLDEKLKNLLDEQSDLKPILRKLDDEIAPHAYTQFVGKLLEKALDSTRKEQRIELINRVLELLAATDGLDYIKRHKLLYTEKNLLTEVNLSAKKLIRPATPLSASALLTGQGLDPPLEHELRSEMFTADRVDILISFIKWSGLRLLMPAFERLAQENIPVRIISTSYMGASDPVALEWLANQKNISVRVSYDTGGTRLHAKAYHFVRKSGFSTAYIGSANMSHSAMTQGLEWTVKVTAQDMPHILNRFVADFSAYWESTEFEPFTEKSFPRFRKAINSYKQRSNNELQFFAEITPRPFQLRILEALAAARQNNSLRNLVVAATGTGKTVISALDYKRYAAEKGAKERLLFVVHRKEILEQALGCFRTVLQDQNFGELLVDGREPADVEPCFCLGPEFKKQKALDILGRRLFSFCNCR